jgi:hypothetical protein
MSSPIEIPPVLYTQVVAVAESAKLSVEDFVIQAVGEKLASLQHHEWLTGNGPSTAENPCGDS